MSRRIVFVDEAERQLETLDRWWREHRLASPELFLEELDQAIELLGQLPDIGSPFKRANRRGLRRLLLRRSSFWVDYFHDPRRSIVYILALWSTSRGSDPDLPDPKLR